MKEIPIGYLREALTYCCTTGVLLWKVRPENHFKTLYRYKSWNGLFAGKRAGCEASNGYRTICVNGKNILEHRVAWALFYGVWPDGEIDHVDHVRNNNKITNLRVVDHAENGLNQSMRVDNTTGVTGVYWVEKHRRWRALAYVQKKIIHIGYFGTFQEAVLARQRFNAVNFHSNHGKGLITLTEKRCKESEQRPATNIKTSSKFKGVTGGKPYWMARAIYKGHRYYLGMHRTELHAALAVVGFNLLSGTVSVSEAQKQLTATSTHV